nr:developmentally-regulated GTP-binding protein 2 isoform X1 [Loxodonta africana]
MKSGDARVALIGFPSVGKSTFLSLMTSTASEAASYEFTTLTCIPGVIEYKGANIQLLDLPGIIEGAAQGKGRGRQVIAVARTADVVIMMLDATKGEVQRSLLEKELESVGIRLNKHKPNIYFKPKKGGGISFNSTVTLTQCSEKLVQLILHEYKIFNAEVLFREDCSPDEFIDVIVGNRVYMPCLYVYNKIDQISMEEVDRLARKPNSVVIRETRLHRCHHPPERGFRGARGIHILSGRVGCPSKVSSGFLRLPVFLDLHPYPGVLKGACCPGDSVGRWVMRCRRHQVTTAAKRAERVSKQSAIGSTGRWPASSNTPWCGAPAPSTAHSGWD